MRSQQRRVAFRGAHIPSFHARETVHTQYLPMRLKSVRKETVPEVASTETGGSLHSLTGTWVLRSWAGVVASPLPCLWGIGQCTRCAV